jgi:phosphate-selective porin OprO/OprP
MFLWNAATRGGKRLARASLRAVAGLVVMTGAALAQQTLPFVQQQPLPGQQTQPFVQPVQSPGQQMVPFAQQAQGFGLQAQPAADDSKSTIERLEKEVQQLKEKVDKQSSASKEDGKKDEKKDDKSTKQDGDWYEVGTDLKVSASFNDYGYLWLETPNKDFRMHPGMWVQYDNVWWKQSKDLLPPPGSRPGLNQGVASGIAAGGIGDLQDGTYFRRVRPFVEGTAWEVLEYRLIVALENNQFSTTGLDEMWMAVNKIPVIGTVRVGHVKNALGLEADMTASSRTMTFMERSAYSEAIEQNQNFVTGIWFHNDWEERATYTFTAWRADQGASSGVFFGDGQYGMSARLTALPLYEQDGRHLLHLGVAGSWRNGTNNTATSPLRTIQLRARPELRDDDPAAGPSGSQTVPNANDNRLIDTGSIAADGLFIGGLELLYVLGPFSVQAEYGASWLHDAIGVAPAGYTLNPAIIPTQSYFFHGGYLQFAYTLTGENRAYDRRLGTLAREYFGPKGPFSRAWLVEDEEGHLCCGTGAWEVACRLSHVDLNDGSDNSRIQGGQLDGLSVALNWYLNPNLTINFDGVYDHRYACPAGTNEGWVWGFGSRVQISF